MSSHTVLSFDPFFPPDVARSMVELCAAFGSYGMYSEEGLNEGIGEGLPQRFDAVMNFLETGGRLAQPEPLEMLGARTNYFRETYAYGDEVHAPGIEAFLHHPGFLDGACQIYERPIVVPAIAYANLLVPGQELATHTDVPEFRGANRKVLPEWLMVVMHHSGLFEAWRMPIATGISWFHDCEGGQLAYYPDGPEAAPSVHEVRYNTALLMDSDSVFHGIDRVAEKSTPIPPLRPGMRLVHEGQGVWAVHADGTVPARYPWADLRFSISWKAYVFADEAERRAWETHSDDLSVDGILERLTAELRSRGRLKGEPASNRDFAILLVNEFVHFPKPSA